MRTISCLLLAAVCLTAPVPSSTGGEPASPPPRAPATVIRFPKLVQPVVPPAPKPVPGAVPKLTADTLYVFDADTPLIVLSSPAGLVRIVKDSGPLRIRGRFVDGDGKTETRTYKGVNVFTVEAVGVGRVELLAIPEGAKTEADVQRVSIDVDNGEAPRPPPTPVPPVPTPPNPSPAPIPAAGLHVLIVYESGDKLPAAQQSILYGKAVREYLDTNCVKETNGWRAYRIYDKDTVVSAESKVWQDAMTRRRDKLPWLIISNATKGGGYEGPLPATVEETLTILRKWGG